MKKIIALLILIGVSTNAFAWDSETGSGVVSSNETIVRTSLEATQVLQSDTLTNLYGVTILGGTTNYASFNSGGVLSFKNVVSSRDVVRFNNDMYIQMQKTDGTFSRLGISADNSFVLPAFTTTNASFDNVRISGTLAVSGNTTLVTVKAGNVSADAVSATSTQVSSLNNSGATYLSGNVATVATAILDMQGNERIQFSAATSPVNQVNLHNSATGSPVKVVASGDDTNIGISLDAKGTGVVSANHAFITKKVTLTDAATIATDASQGNHFAVTLGGNRTLARPTNPTNGQRAIWEIRQDSNGTRTISFDDAFIFGTDVTRPTLGTGEGKRGFVGAIYNGTSWDVVAVSQGYNRV